MKGLENEDFQTVQNKDEHLWQYNGKERQDDFDLFWLDYGARNYDSQLGRFHTVDRFSEKYYSLTAYQYAANNPISFIDVNGDSIGIISQNGDVINYTQGMKYEGDDEFVGKVVQGLNNLGKTKNGSKLLGKLIDNESSFNFANKVEIDSEGNEYTGTLNFVEGENGGGTINAGTILKGMSEGKIVHKLGHELFHGYQHNKGQGGASIMNEVEAYLFEYSVANEFSLYQLDNGNVPELSSVDLGREGELGTLWTNSINNLYNASKPSMKDFSNAVRSFKRGAVINSSGLYNNLKPRKENQKKLMIFHFYPLK